MMVNTMLSIWFYAPHDFAGIQHNVMLQILAVLYGTGTSTEVEQAAGSTQRYYIAGGSEEEERQESMEN